MCYDDRPIKVEVVKDVFYLTLHRPEDRNALDQTMLSAIEEALDEAETNDAIKAIIIQGAGDKVFAAGADIKQLNAREPLEALVPGMQGLYNKIENSKKVTIAAINGFALGGGCELALACDIRVATEKAKFGLPELNLGIIPGAGGTQRLSKIVGKGRALDMILTGKIIDGKEAERIGLVSYVTEVNDLPKTLDRIVENIRKKAPVALHLAKSAIHKGYDIDLDAALWIEKLSQSVAFGTDDKHEGTLAFIEKREADFKNK